MTGNSSKTVWRRMTVAAPDAGTRLDVWLSARIDGLSRRRAAKLIGSGEARVNDRAVSKGTALLEGDCVTVERRPALGVWYPRPDDAVSLEVLYEDDDLVAVDKPSGVPSVPLSADETGTLAGFVAHRFPACRTVYRRLGDGGLVQRLDRETSGVVLAARSQPIHDVLVGAQSAGKIEKTYLALVQTPNGEPPSTIDMPLAGVGSKGRKMAPADDGLPARTEVVVTARYPGHALVEAVIHKGMRHQIRAHLAAVGCPIVGDRVYGDGAVPSGRLFLHAHRVAFRHPKKMNLVRITSELPELLREVIESM